MMKPRLEILASIVTSALVLCAAPRIAHASSTFPPKVQEALTAEFKQTYCVPQCIICHQTNAGGFGTLNDFAKNLRAASVEAAAKGGPPPLGALSPDTVGPAFKTYFMDKPNADSDGDGKTDRAELEAGNSPAVKGPRGDSLICPDIQYGCGAHIAASPPRTDRVALLSAGLALLGLAFAYRRRAATRA